MDTFLTKLYEEEMEKQAGSELQDFMQTVPVSDLEAYLGIAKVAVDGASEAPLPDAVDNKALEAKQQQLRKRIDQAHNSNPPPQHIDTRTTNQVKEAMRVGDAAGRILAKLAACKMNEADSEHIPPQAPVGGKEGEELEKEERISNKLKAAMVLRAFRTTRGAPEHIKQAAVVLTGQQLAKTAGMLGSTGTGALLGAGIGALGGEKGKRWQGARKGALIGGGIGLGSSAGSHLAKLHPDYNALRYMHPESLGEAMATNPAVLKAALGMAGTGLGGAAAGGVAGGIGGAAIERRLRKGHKK